GEVEVAEEVAVHGEERPLAEQGKRQGNSAGGFERFGFARVADRDAEAASIAERGFDHMTEVRVIDHDLANARARERLDPPDDQIAVLAVPKGKAREDSQHLELALGSHPLEIPIEIGEITADRQPLGAGLLPIADRPIDDAFLAPSDVGVAQERYEVVGDRAV